MPCNPDILKNVSLFALLDDDEMAVLASQVELKHFDSRQRIYKVGDPGGLIILATGLGPVTPTVANGADSTDALRTTVTTPVVLVGGVPAQVVFSGLSPNFVGVNQINVMLPAGTPTGDQVSLQIQMGGQTSTNQVTIAVSQ